MPTVSKYTPDKYDDWAFSLAMRGATDEEIAEAMKISRKTIQRWRKQYESFNEAVERGKNIADAKVERSLYERATGYTTTDTEKIVEVDTKTGQSKPVKIRTVTKQLPPDTMAVMYWLNNRKRDEWGNGRNKTQETNNAVDDWVNSIPDVEVEEIENPKKK